MASKLGFKITGMYSIFFFFFSGFRMLLIFHVHFFFSFRKVSSSQGMVCGFIDLFSAFFPALFFNWFAKANLTFDVYGIY